jgi:transposase
MTYDVNDIMRRYNVTQHTVLGWIASGELKAINVGTVPGKRKPRWRITEAAIAEFEAQRATTPTKPRQRKSPARAGR